MKVLLFLVVNLAVSSAFLNPDEDVIEIGEEKDITDANKGLIDDDILESPDIQRSAILGESRLWPSPVPYVLGTDLGMNAKGVILRAFEQFRLKSCIDFKPRDSEDYFISVRKLGGCFSYIGRVLANGQTLSIGRYCDTIAIVEHEFLHALGFNHEQSRYDRDDYVTIAFENIQSGYENNFVKKSKDVSTTQGVKYDYMSVMHYGPYAFSNGNGTTINTKDPAFQSVIGQRLEVSPSDVLELNLLYKCNSSVAFRMYCGFSNRNMCEMTQCSKSGNGWEVVKKVPGGPSSDHTTLPSGSNTHHTIPCLKEYCSSTGNDDSYFMHASTTSGQAGDSARLETKRMRLNRECNIQCLQFYYYHTGNESDQLNIWIREFKHELDVTGSMRLMGQITGQQTSHWQIQHVSLNANRDFQVVFEVRKGAGMSSGGFSIDDINLSETECPQVTMQLDDFEHLLNTSAYRTVIYSPLQYSRAGYAYKVGAQLLRTSATLFVQFFSGKYDDQLEWPVPQRQVTFQILDQNPYIRQQMSKQSSITSDNSVFGPNNTYVWGNPREVGTQFVNEKNETMYAGFRLGKPYFARLEQIKTRDYLKGGSIVFLFNFQDLTPLVNGSALPCPKVRQVPITNPPKDLNEGPCSRVVPSTHRPSITHDPHSTHHPPITHHPHSTHHPPITRHPNSTHRPPPRTTEDKSIFGFSPAMVASPVLTLLLALMLLMR